MVYNGNIDNIGIWNDNNNHNNNNKNNNDNNYFDYDSKNSTKNNR